MPTVDYADFDLVITRLARGKYQARVIDSPAGQAQAEFRRPFSETELENFVLRIGRTRTGTRRLDSPEMQAAETFGTRLFEKVFRESVRECLMSSLHQVDRNEVPGLRLRLRLVGVPELADLPWEYLYHPTRRFIVLSTQTPITRYTDLPHPVAPLAVAAPLRLLVMVASPPDYPPLDVDQEKAKMRDALYGLEHSGLIVLEWLENASLSALQQRLRRGPVHLFHFIGHGAWDERAQDGVLLFEDEHGRGRRVSAGRLGPILRDHRSLRLVVLNACEGARVSSTDPFAGVAGTLVQQGIPAVVAMQFEITDRTAIQLAHVFYESLADGYPAEAALAEARKAIFASGNDVEWGTPVLYLRAPDGRLFDLTVPSSREAERLAAQQAEQERQARELAEAERIRRERAEQGQPAQELVEHELKREQLAEERQSFIRTAIEKAAQFLSHPAFGGIGAIVAILACIAAFLAIPGIRSVFGPAAATPTNTPTFTSSPTPSPSPTFTPTSTHTSTDTPTPTHTHTASASATASPTPTATPTPTRTPTRTRTATLPATRTRTATPTSTTTPVPPTQPPEEPPPEPPPPTSPPPTLGPAFHLFFPHS